MISHAHKHNSNFEISVSIHEQETSFVIIRSELHFGLSRNLNFNVAYPRVGYFIDVARVSVVRMPEGERERVHACVGFNSITHQLFCALNENEKNGQTVDN